MKVEFDALFLTLFFRPNTHVKGQPPDAASRINYLVENLSTSNAKIVIPTPALGEFLMLAESDGPLYLAEIDSSDVFTIAPYDIRAAVEAASLMSAAKRKGDKRGGATGTWQKIKVDWQIAAIGQVEGVECVYSDDGDLE